MTDVPTTGAAAGRAPRGTASLVGLGLVEETSGRPSAELEAELRPLVAQAVAATGMARGAVNLLDGTHLQSIAAHGFQGGRVLRESTVRGQVTGRAPNVYAFADLDEEPGFRGNPFVDGRLDRLRGYASAPLVVNGSVVGTLALFSSTTSPARSPCRSATSWPRWPPSSPGGWRPPSAPAESHAPGARPGGRAERIGEEQRPAPASGRESGYRWREPSSRAMTSRQPGHCWPAGRSGQRRSSRGWRSAASTASHSDEPSPSTACTEPVSGGCHARSRRAGPSRRRSSERGVVANRRAGGR